MLLVLRAPNKDWKTPPEEVVLHEQDWLGLLAAAGAPRKAHYRAEECSWMGQRMWGRWQAGEGAGESRVVKLRQAIVFIREAAGLEVIVKNTRKPWVARG